MRKSFEVSAIGHDGFRIRQTETQKARRYTTRRASHLQSGGGYRDGTMKTTPNRALNSKLAPQLSSEVSARCGQLRVSCAITSGRLASIRCRSIKAVTVKLWSFGH